MTGKPTDWDDVAITDFGEIVGGGTPSRATPSFWNGTIPWVTPTEITALRGKYVRETQEQITPDGLAGSAARLLPAGSVVVTTRASLGMAAIAAVPLTTNQGFKSIIPNENTDSLFAYYRIQTLKSEMVRLASGTTFLEISKADFSRIRTRRPKPKEQSRIALVLDTVDEAIAKAEAVIAKLRQVRAGLLHDLLTRGLDEHGRLRDPIAHPEQFQPSPLGQIPREWHVSTIESLLAPVPHAMRSGPFGSSLLKQELKASGIPLLGIDNVHIERFVDKCSRFVDYDKFQELKQYRVRPADIMITIMGTVGRCCVVPENVGTALSSKHVWTISLDRRHYSPHLACWQLNHAAWALRQLRVDEQGGVMTAIRSETLRRMRLPVPTPSETVAIERLLLQHNLGIASEEAELAKLVLLKSGLMTDLLTGRVRVPPGKENKPSRRGAAGGVT